MTTHQFSDKSSLSSSKSNTLSTSLPVSTLVLTEDMNSDSIV